MYSDQRSSSSHEQTNRPPGTRTTQTSIHTSTTATTTAAGTTAETEPATRTMNEMISVPGWLPAAAFLCGFILGVLGRRAREK